MTGLVVYVILLFFIDIFRIVLIYCVGLIPVTVTAALVGLAGWIYLVGALVLGLMMLWYGFRLSRRRSREAARRLFLASIVYLPCLFLLMLLDPTRVTGLPF